MKRSTLGNVGRAGLWGLFGSILGTGKQLLIGPLFGATGNTDAFFAASQLPRRMGELLGFEVMKGALTSHFSSISEKEKLSYRFSAIMNAILILGSLFSILLVVFAGPVMSLLVKGFEESVLLLSIQLARIVLPVILLIGLTNLLSSLLNSLHCYNVIGIVRVVVNFTAILFIVFFYRSWGVYSLAVGYLTGWFLAVVIQVPMLLKRGIRYHPFFQGQWALIREIFRLLTPLFLGIFISQINAFVILGLASMLDAGSVSAMNYSMALFGTLVVVTTQPFFVVLLPKISKTEKFDLSNKLQEYSTIFIFIFVPVAFFLFSQAHLIVAIIFGRGDFDLRAIEITSNAFKANALGVFFWASSLLFMQFFLAQKKTLTIGIVDFVTIALHIALNFILVKHYNLFGLVLAMSIAHGLRYFVYGFILGKQGILSLWNTYKELLLAVIAVIPGILGIVYFKQFFIELIGPKFGGVFFEVSIFLILSLVFGLSYLIFSNLLRLQGPRLAWQEISKTRFLRYLS